MLAQDSDERPSFVELREVFRSPQLDLNIDNESFVDGLMRDKIVDRTS